MMSSSRARVAIATAIVIALAASSATLQTAGAARARRASRGTVSVIYAGSLVDYMENDFGPSFEKASGYSFNGYGGGSGEDAAEIKGGVRRADVFVSAAASADELLEGKANENWVSWYSTFAASPLVLGYDPHSRYGAQLAHGKPWYEVLTQPGILVGRTEPMLDPKGVLTVEAIDNAARKLHDPKLKGALSSFPVYPETALVGRLQAGQLEAGFFYAAEAAAAHFPTVSLKPVFKYALYTVTILKGDADPNGAAALVKYLLSASGRYALKRNGFEALKPKFSGHASDVPKSLRTTVGAG